MPSRALRRAEGAAPGSACRNADQVAGVSAAACTIVAASGAAILDAK